MSWAAPPESESTSTDSADMEPFLGSRASTTARSVLSSPLITRNTSGMRSSSPDSRWASARWRSIASRSGISLPSRGFRTPSSTNRKWVWLPSSMCWSYISTSSGGHAQAAPVHLPVFLLLDLAVIGDAPPWRDAEQRDVALAQRAPTHCGDAVRKAVGHDPRIRRGGSLRQPARKYEQLPSGIEDFCRVKRIPLRPRAAEHRDEGARRPETPRFDEQRPKELTHLFLMAAGDASVLGGHGSPAALEADAAKVGGPVLVVGASGLEHVLEDVLFLVAVTGFFLPLH
eukprot:scaffold82761_cov48-Phaeocystis_antarctica.AAC.1